MAACSFQSCLWQILRNQAQLWLLLDEESELIYMSNIICPIQQLDVRARAILQVDSKHLWDCKKAEDKENLIFISNQDMGNDNSNKSHLYDKFYQICHPGLVQYQFSQQQQLLFSRVRVEQSFIIWRKLADPLLSKRQLFMPLKIVAPEHLVDYGCCAQEDFHRPDMQFKTIYYSPFIYTFDKQITNRKEKNVLFREQQLWKLIKYMSRALLQWNSVYPSEKIGIICPFNLLIDPSGQVKLVCRLSFFNNEYSRASEAYSPPESRQNSIIKYSLNPNKDPFGIQASSVYSMGMVVLQAATLQLSEISCLQVIQKQTLMHKSSSYSVQLKQLINKMLDHSQALRPKLHQLLQYAKNHKTRHA